MGSRVSPGWIFPAIVLLSLVFIASACFLVFDILYPIEIMGAGAGSGEDGASPALIIAAVTSSVTGLGTISTILLGWRNDRRVARETELRIARLEQEIEEAKRLKNGSARAG